VESNLPLNGSIDLDALDDYRMSDNAADESMGRPASGRRVKTNGE